MQNRCHVGEQVEDLPLRPTLWNLSLRKLLSLSLNNPLCQALSKAFAMSKKLTFMAIDGIWSKPALILWTIDVSCFSQESFGRKPGRAGETNFFFSRNRKIWLNIILSKILEYLGRSGTEILSIACPLPYELKQCLIFSTYLKIPYTDYKF